MRKLLLSILMLCVCFMATAQEMPKIVPPSPEASALAQFTNVPVSHYTGLPNISVPIYTIQQKGISIPISLSYHARGVMVSETAPRTGMGWSLQYGGSISRQVRGKADESSHFGYLANRNEFMKYSSDIEARRTVSTRESADSSYDFYPDQFSFSAGGVSGKFVLDYTNGEPVVQSFDDVKVSYTMGSGNGISGIAAFIVTDSKGNHYYFGISKDGTRTAQDYQQSNGVSIPHGGAVVFDSNTDGNEEINYSAWKLMDIETSYGELISYYYEGIGRTVYHRKVYDKHNSNGTATNSAANMSNISAIYTRLSKVWDYEKQLAMIEFNEGRDRIVFNKSEDVREDFEGHSLDKISIYNNNRLIKLFKLNYSYTKSMDQTNLLWYFQDNDGLFSKYFKRMFLASVEEEGRNGEKLPPYLFTYDPQILPSVFSSRQDYWGYYNGATNNGPFTRMFDYGMYTSDRRVDTLKSEAGILKEIQYPTGGITKFTYEHNKGVAPEYFNKIILPSINPAAEDEVEIVLTKANFAYNQATGYTPYTLELPHRTQINYRFDCFHFRDENDPSSATIPDCIFSLLVDGQQVNSGENMIISTGNNYSGTSTIRVLPINVQGYPNLHLNSNYGFRITIKYDTPDDRTNIYAAGKRIKRIENIDGAGNSIVKEYEYAFSGEERIVPSGSIIGFPAYLNTDTFAGFTIISAYNDATSAYSSFQPNSIGYSSVIEYKGTKENNLGKTEYTFTNLSDTGGDYYEFPYHPPTDNEWLRGKNIRTKVFKRQEGGGYSLAKEVYNKYLYGDNEYPVDFEYPGLLYDDFIFTPQGTEHIWEDNVPSIYIKNKTLYKLPLFLRTRTPPNSSSSSTREWGYRIYHLTGGTNHLLRTVEKDYLESGLLEKTTTYSYDYNNHYQVKSTQVTDSKGDVNRTTNYYPTDLSADALSDISMPQSTYINTLQADNRMEVIQQSSFKNDLLQATTRTSYLDTYGMVLPKAVQTAKGTAPLEDRIVYHSYDTKGNPVEVSKADGTRIRYVWGYDQTQPIAKIEGYTCETITDPIKGDRILCLLTDAQSQAITNAVAASLNETTAATENNLRAKLQLLKDSFANTNVQVTTYTYDPLIGVTSMTDPRGETLYYTYDAFNRLEHVKDAEGNILNKNEYNYKN